MGRVSEGNWAFWKKDFMIFGKKVLGLILARSGSKGLRHKNILNLAGKPLLLWTSEVAKKSVHLDKLAISTDGFEIVDIARKNGIEVPFTRPQELSDDNASSIDAILHALSYYSDIGENYDYLVLLEPTSPLREVSDIDSPLNQLEKNRKIADSIVSVVKVEGSHSAFQVGISDKGLISAKKNDYPKHMRRQDLATLYVMEGTTYISSVEKLIRKKSFYHNRTLAYEVPKWKALEVDDIVDLIHAEASILNKERISNIHNGTVY